MPIIDFSFVPEELQVAPLLAVMMFPTDSERREEFLTMASEQTKVFKPEGKQSTLFQVLDYACTAFFEKGHPILHGTLAGRILTAMRKIAVHHTRYAATLDRAIAIVAAGAKGQRTLDGGVLVPCNPRSIRSAWSKYKSVAHLYSALSLLQEDRHREQIERGDDSNDFKHLVEVLDDLPKLFGVAQDMLAFGAEHLLINKAAGGVQQPLIDMEATWQPSRHMPVSEIKVCLSPLSKPAYAVLRNFRSADRG